MMRAAFLILPLLFLASCGPPEFENFQGRNGVSPTPSSTEPGIRISGQASVGAVRKF